MLLLELSVQPHTVKQIAKKIIIILCLNIYSCVIFCNDIVVLTSTTINNKLCGAESFARAFYIEICFNNNYSLRFVCEVCTQYGCKMLK